MAIEQFDTVIIGAGAAGLMCAAVAGKRGRKVLLVDHANKVGKKILISGGGRCNFTNLYASPDQYISQNPHFMKSAFSKFTQHDFIEMVDRYHIPWHEKTLGQLFCDGSAREIVAMLVNECSLGKVTIRENFIVESIEKQDDAYLVNSNIKSKSLVIATGGPSIPLMGATDFAYKIARQFGIKIIEPRPALVPFTLGGDEKSFTTLSGTATDVVVSCGKTSFREALLFTHKGISGPAVLQISSYWKHGQKITVNFLPDLNENWLLNQKKENPKITIVKLLSQHLPNRLADFICELTKFPTQDIGNVPDKKIAEIEAKLFAWEFSPNGTEGYRKAEVTIGGINTDALSSKTMEVKKAPGLYFIGEAVDVTGWLGGYNFQWAWASGYAAGMHL